MTERYPVNLRDRESVPSPSRAAGEYERRGRFSHPAQMSVSKQNSHPCVDCGSTQVNHRFAYFSVYLEHFTSRKSGFIKSIEAYLMPRLAPAMNWLLIVVLEALAFVKIISKITEADKRTSDRARVFWEAANKRGLSTWEYRIFGARLNTYGLRAFGKTYVFNSLLLPEGREWQSKSAAWLDNKALMREHFREVRIPIADGGVAANLDEAQSIFARLRKPVITKPSEGSRSRHTTTHINTKEELELGYKKANQLSPWVIVEEELVGAVYRITLVGNKVIAVCYRGVAEVVGDGSHTVQELAELENKNPLRSGPHFHHLPTKESADAAAEAELVRQKISWESVPIKDTLVTLGTKTSRGSGGSIIDVTDKVHPENWALFEKIGKYLNDPLVGIDFIIADMAKPWSTQERSGVIECNGMPFIDLHHYPLEGPVRDVASKLLELNFPQLTQTQNS